jgi:hypothetical protein
MKSMTRPNGGISSSRRIVGQTKAPGNANTSIMAIIFTTNSTMFRNVFDLCSTAFVSQSAASLIRYLAGRMLL